MKTKKGRQKQTREREKGGTKVYYSPSVSIFFSPVYSNSNVPIPLVHVSTIVIFFCPAKDFSLSKNL